MSGVGRFILQRNRRGFTLVELLVVIAVIGVLASLLLPAIQAARRSASRTACVNNSRQIGLACAAHHSALRFYPTGGGEWWTPPSFVHGRPSVGRQQDAGWAFQILPYLEGVAEWSGGAGQTDEARTLIAIETPQPVYFCPARRGPQSLVYADPLYLGGIEIKHALIDYAASNFDGTGIVRQREPTTVRQVLDGISKTLIVGEKRLNVSELGKWQEDDNEGYTAAWDEDSMRRTSIGPQPDHNGFGDGGERFGSSHDGVFNAVFADGSVHGISYTVDEAVFRRMGDRADGQSFTLEDL